MYQNQNNPQNQQNAQQSSSSSRSGRTVVPEAKGALNQMKYEIASELGINLKDVTDKLEADGVAAFIKSWDSVLADVQSGIDRVNA